jgi:hypothetical protein
MVSFGTFAVVDVAAAAAVVALATVVAEPDDFFELLHAPVTRSVASSAAAPRRFLMILFPMGPAP